MISYLCKVAGVSRSGYYKYFSSESKDLRKSREDKDILSKENVLKAFNFKGRKKGARQIKMVLKDRFNIIYNLKRIRRIMKKYGIVCPYRKANPYRRMMKASKEHTIVSNFINREFKQDIPYKVLLTDITYLSYKNGKKALSEISTSLTPGVYGLLGPNGAGKSTLMNIITDNLRPTAGEVLLDGNVIWKNSFAGSMKCVRIMRMMMLFLFMLDWCMRSQKKILCMI